MSARCLGYDEKGKAFPCPNTPGTPWTKHWCAECDERRKAGITRNLQALVDSIAAAKEKRNRGEVT